MILGIKDTTKIYQNTLPHSHSLSSDPSGSTDHCTWQNQYSHFA